MSRVLAVLSLAVAFGAWGCGRDIGPKGQAPTPAAPAGPSLGSYFAPEAPESTPRACASSRSRRRRGPSRSGPSASAATRGSSCCCCTAAPARPTSTSKALESFLAAEGIEFIYYDQLGSAYSDQPKDESLWTIERFVDEVEQVRQALGLDQGRLLPARPVLGRHPRHRVRAQAPAAPQGARHLEHDDEHPRLQPLRERRAREGDGPGGGEGDPGAREEGPVREPALHGAAACRTSTRSTSAGSRSGPTRSMRSFGKLNKQVYVLDAGPERVRRLGPAREVGPQGRPRQDHGADARDRRDPRHDGPRAHALGARRR